MTSSWEIETKRLVLRLLSVEALQLTAAGNIAEVERLLECAVLQYWNDVKRLALMRLEQLANDPAYLAWSIRAVILRETNSVVGYVNFHAQPLAHSKFPQASNMAEIGYTIFEPWRRRGIASEALAAMLRFAAEKGADQAVLSIAPDNLPSLRLASRFGFVKIGTQIDEIDGPEDVYLLSSLER